MRYVVQPSWARSAYVRVALRAERPRRLRSTVMSTSEASRRARRLARKVLPRAMLTPTRQHNMHEHEGEHYYLEQYMTVLTPLLTSKQRILDVGCQYGRLLLPLAAQGHDVVGTDIDADCLAYIRERLPAAELRCESADVTSTAHTSTRFDLVLCLELLYLLADWPAILSGLANQLAPGGHLAASHRSQGYYIHRFLRERRYDELDQILAGNHRGVNAQSPQDLEGTYVAAGLTVESMTAIGAFSGTEVDPFAAVNDPSRLSPRERTQLMRYESDPALSTRFAESARYLLVVASRR
jgi:2-polyprenyl-3-methyl-5-hydroxy-6-metoxy-1,4-benzoquinol methylase